MAPILLLGIVACAQIAESPETPSAHESMAETEAQRRAEAWLDEINAAVKYDEQGSIAHVLIKRRWINRAWSKFDYRAVRHDILHFSAPVCAT